MTDHDKEALFEKIRKLLRKAESTKFEEEANAFIQKAQELMLRYQIDEEKLWKDDPQAREKIETITITVNSGSPGSQYQRIILSQVAQLSNSRMWFTEGTDKCTVAGFSVDLAWVDMLFASILVQARFKMVIAQAASTTNARTFRTNWWRAYCDRICERLRETYRNAERVIDASASTSTSLVLADRNALVNAYVSKTVKLRSSSYRDSSRYDDGASSAGRKAANETDISGGRRKAIGAGKKGLNA